MQPQTQRVIQNLQLVDVPVDHQLCYCCGLYQPGRPARRLHGIYSGGICATCNQLPLAEQDRLVAATRAQFRSGRYYTLSEQLRVYRAVVEGGITVRDLITRLQALDPAAYVSFRYNDSDDGEQFSVPSPNPDDRDEIMGVPYYLL